MFRPYGMFIGLRYTRARRRNGFISFISLISMLGIALGVTALITVLSVMNGFEEELRERILGVASHVTISGWDGPLGDWAPVAEGVATLPRVAGVAPFVELQGLLTHDDRASGVLVRGVLPEREPEVSTLGDSLVDVELGALTAGGYGIILGRELAQGLGAQVGEKVTLVIPEAQITAVGMLPRLRRFTVIGFFEAGMYAYDSGLAMVHMADAQRLERLGDAVSGVRVRLHEVLQAPAVARELQELFPMYGVSDWTRQNVNYFRAVRTEKIVMFVILSLIVAVAAFNIISTLVMVVTDKQSDIAILRTIGATPLGIMTVFMVQGVIIGAIGTLLGGVGGVLLALNVETLVPLIERLIGVEVWPDEVYYISELPSTIRWSEVGLILGLSFSLSMLATLYPAWRGARTDPARALRYE